MSQAVASALIVIGSIFSLLAAVGITRMPDVFMRMQTTAKAGTLGLVCILLAVAFHFQEAGVTARTVFIILFVFLTAPVGAQLIARSAYLSGVKRWKGTIRDELKERLPS
ncbi:MAG: monovalent cation/H(+) antiporter subunit G [Candidatus Omnitrophica bacterium]|nr:monovalent cation/H(+) antiporter subunit G [Candidatus Omnitrophota bacterium]